MAHPEHPSSRLNPAGELYGKSYYDQYRSSSGVPYDRAEPWLTHFRTLADHLIRLVGAQTVLDTGCAKGFLVEALRDRGIEAFGIDISEYAVSQVRQDVKPYCWIASVTEPFPQRYDLIVCFEVLEHLPKAEAELAVRNLCRHADDVLFSSSPDDFTELTHVNVQPVEYWAELFALEGFYHDLDFDVSVVADHAMRFRKATLPTRTLVRSYERALWPRFKETQSVRRLNLELNNTNQRLEIELSQAVQVTQRLEGQLAEASRARQQLEIEAREREQHIAEREQHIAEQEQHIVEREEHIARQRTRLEESETRVAALEKELREIRTGLGWQLLSAYSQVKNHWLPPGGRGRAWYEAVTRALKICLGQGPAVLLRRVVAKVRAKVYVADVRDMKVGASGRGPSIGSRATRVLIISGSEGPMERYRCNHAQEQFQLEGISADFLHLRSLTVLEIVMDYEVIILHRVLYSEGLEEIVRIAHANHALVLFDIDDLLFDPDVIDRIEAFRVMDPTHQALYRDMVRRYRLALTLCDAALLTTDTMVEATAKVGVPGWVHRNALSLELIRISEKARRTRRRDRERVIVGYASGSPTHNRDFGEVETALERILEAYPQAEFWIIGYLDLKETWTKWEERIKRWPFVPWQELPALLAQLDINLVPLEMDNPFCQAKSELKYIEAAAVGVPTVASKIGAFEFAIRHGDNGLLAEHSEAWFQAIAQLIQDPTLRAEMGSRACADVLQRYHPKTRGCELMQTLKEIAMKVRVNPCRV